MSPTIFRERGYRFFFFSREERRMHVHVVSADGEAKFWLEPDVELARSHGCSRQQLKEIRALVEERREVIINAWHMHFGG